VSPLCGNALDALVARGLKAPVLCIIDEHAGLRAPWGWRGNGLGNLERATAHCSRCARADPVEQGIG
jgi:hypothetical protein